MKCFIVITISYGSDFPYGFDDYLNARKKVGDIDHFYDKIILFL